MRFKAVCATALAMLAAGQARANPFNVAQGEGQLFFTSILTGSPKGFDDRGHVANIPDYRQAQIYVTGEYGVTDRLNLIVGPSYRSVQVDGPNNDTAGLGFTDLGARYQVASGGNWKLDVQGLVRIPGKKRSDSAAQVSDTGTEYEARALGGYIAGPTFFALEAGYRWRDGAPQNEIHVDLTIGTRVAPKLLLLAASYNVISDGRGRSIFNQRFRYHDLYLSASYEVTSRLSVQLGATATVDGRNALRQRGPTVGFWYKF